MSSHSPLSSPWPWNDLGYSFNIQPHQIFMTLALVILLPVAAHSLWTKSRYPLGNPPGWFQLKSQKEREYARDGLEILKNTKKAHPGSLFALLTDCGESTIFPSPIAHVIRNMTALSFRKAIVNDFHGNLPGLEPFGLLDNPSEVIQKVVRKQLTRRLNTVAEPMSSEATFAINHAFGNSSEWKDVRIAGSILDLIARISSRVFLGDELCRHEQWLQITQTYTILAFKVIFVLRSYPRFVRPIVNRFHPDSKAARDALAQSRCIINGLIEKRKRLKAECQANSLPVPSYNDAIEWAEVEANGYPYDPAVLQLTLSFAAIHTTTDLLTQILLLLSREPENIEPLRKEIIEVLQVEGWKKSALLKMKLLDSAVKEAQRLKPNDLLEMRRIALEDVTLPDGTLIRKGERILVDNTTVSNPDIYQHPEKFDIHRFKRMREEDPDQEHIAQLVSTSPGHLSFGHGKYACPGRFFAANEIKLALCHLLLKYDWKAVPGDVYEPLIIGTGLVHNPAIRLQFRRRQEEIDLESLKVDDGTELVED